MANRMSSSAPHVRVRTIEILWHTNEQNEEAERFGMMSTTVAEGITSIDYHPLCHRIVTTGGDGQIRLWDLNPTSIEKWLDSSVNSMESCCEHVCAMKSTWMPLTARWSPKGELIASAHCEGKICLWWREGTTHKFLDSQDKEIWKDYRHLFGHTSDVHDLCFSPDSCYLLSGSIGGSILIHDLDSSTPVLTIPKAHEKFCRGVAWDPWNKYVSSFGVEPSLLCFRFVPKNHTRRMHLAGQRKCQGSFFGESCSLSFRRMSWSPDGSILAVPCGKTERRKNKPSSSSGSGTPNSNNIIVEPLETFRPSEEKDPMRSDMLHCVNLYARNALEKIAGRLEIRGYYEIRGVQWAPCFLEPLDGNNFSAAQLHISHEDSGEKQLTNCKGTWGPADYRMALAVWTSDAVIVYTTDSSIRHTDFTDLHMRSITDIAWSPDARQLFTASLDGYISVISFCGSILSVAHRLPLFSSLPVTRSLCQLLSHIAESSAAREENHHSSFFTTQEPVASPPVMVKKKRKIEGKAVAQLDSASEQLPGVEADTLAGPL